jgi:hypothetical protein
MIFSESGDIGFVRRGFHVTKIRLECGAVAGEHVEAHGLPSYNGMISQVHPLLFEGQTDCMMTTQR